MTGEDRFYKNSLRIVNSVFLILILFFVFLIVYYGVIHKQNGIEVDPVYTIDKWTVIDGDGNSFETGGYYTAEKDYDKDFTIVSTIPEEAHDNSFLCLSTGKNLEIYINDELRYSFDNDNDVNIPGGGVKRFYFLVPLSGDDAGAELRIERESTTKRGQIVPETFVSTLGGIYSYMMGKYGLSFMLAEVILIFAVVAFIISIVLKVVYKQQIKMVFGVIGIIVISIWVLTNSLLFPFVFGQYHIDGVLNYMACLMIPFGPGLYLNAIQNGRYKKCMSIMLLISALNALIWPFLHFTGLFPFYEALTIITMILGLLSFAAIVILAIDTFNNPDTYKFELGKGITLKDGDDVTVIATGLVVNEALKAVKALESKGINARLINMHTIKPIDKDIIIKAAKETGKIITVEEHNIIGGLGEAVCSVTSEFCPVPVKRIGIEDIYGHSGPALGLLAEFGLDAEGLEKRIIEIVK